MPASDFEIHACCKPDGSCILANLAQCNGAGGVRKIGKDCTAAAAACFNPVLPQGACCEAASGRCTQTIHAACIGAGLTWTPGKACADACRIPAVDAGACCNFFGNCAETNQADCVAAGGLFNLGSKCFEKGLPKCTALGACCTYDVGGSFWQCWEGIQFGACPGSNAVFHGAGSTCAQVACNLSVAPQGAICQPDGTCSVGPFSAAPVGSFWYVGRTCADAVCHAAFPKGRCCDPATGICTHVAAAGCPPTSHFAPNRTCTPNTCTQPGVGACCDNLTGGCTQHGLHINCPVGSTFYPGRDCNPSPCLPPTFLGQCCDPAPPFNCTDSTVINCPPPKVLKAGSCATNPPCVIPPLGACCNGSACSQKTAADCLKVSAVSRWREGVACEASGLCPPSGRGVCCSLLTPNSCADTSHAQCQSLGGLWADYSTGATCFSPVAGGGCGPSVAPANTAHCCVSGVCVEWTTNAACIAAGGTIKIDRCRWKNTDDQTQCPTPPPLGQCCTVLTGTCVDVTAANCPAPNVWTAGSCALNAPCPQPPTGSCCAADGSCSITTAAACVGAWTSGATCSPNPCAQIAGICCGISIFGVPPDSCVTMPGFDACVTAGGIAFTVGGTGECAALCGTPATHGPCCVMGICYELVGQMQCLAAGGIWPGAAFNCTALDPNTCAAAAPVAACCYIDPMGAGVCTMATQAACFGTWYPAGDCATITCPGGGGMP